MRVYYGENFWGCSKQQKRKKELSEFVINQYFQWDDIKGKIFSLYYGEEGIVIDVGIQVDFDTVKTFMDKWDMQVKQGVSQEELEKIAKDNPLNLSYQMDILLEDKMLERDMSCGLCWYPKELMSTEQAYTDSEEKDVAVRIMDSYGCDRNYAWIFNRFCFRWKDIHNLGHEITMILHEDKKEYEGCHFKTMIGDAEHSEYIQNPVTGEKNLINLYGCHEDSVDYTNSKMEFPSFYYALSYSTSHKQLYDEFRICDCSKGDNPKYRGEITKHKNKETASISVIGGACGPTSVFMAGSFSHSEKEEKNRQIAYSSMYFENQSEIEWKTLFYIQDREDMHVKISL